MVYVIPKEKFPEANKQKRKDNEKENNLFNTMKVFMYFSQALGALPLENVGNLNKMKFKWKSLRTAYTILMIAAFIVVLSCSYMAWVTTSCSFEGIVDWTMGLVARCESLKLDLKENYTYTKYYEELFPELFHILPVNYFTGTFCSLKPESFWIDVREDYNRLTVLCRRLDERISYIVLLTFSTNVFFILVQVYETLKKAKGVISKTYFVLSYFYLVVKIIYLSLYAAWVNDESKEPLCSLNSVSSSSYNTEIRRFLGQIEFDSAVLTGCRMFRVTRGILLSIAGAVVTYELILIQFDEVTKENK
ncbi:unnamed protein product [Acanthoscelides obtectus]|uniref:Gustatory receptor n=1 Tax=Acanthoscelides obtectus TaxID=200917 RepID=A0A9P0P029_ACAOB|nr:unnamed protein product [Acanthoscelides obtectus]CAK1629663.1 Gustatory receptor for sugar taste 64e [Acanthoscelides obtectus]